MPEIGPQMTEPPRQESPGEMQQRLASLLAAAAPLFLGIQLSTREREAVATLIATFFRWKRDHKA
jgi:hypothetical protein